MHKVLVVGLDPHRVPGPWDPEPIATAVRAGMAELAEAGIAARPCWVGLDGSDDIQAVVTDALLADVWDCVVVGGGIVRGESELLELVVNLVRVHAPQAPIAFSAAPDQILTAVRRQLG